MYKIKDKTLEEHFALEIDVDFITGKRAGDIDPRDPNLICLPLWQNLELGKEMRLILDNRDLKQYEGIEGIVIHKGADAINKRVKELFKPRYSVQVSELFLVSIRQLGIDLKSVPKNTTVSEQLKFLSEQGVLGILKEEPELLG